jgi:hypothetical protein
MHRVIRLRCWLRKPRDAVQEGKNLLPAIQRLFGPVRVTAGVEERMPGAVVAMEFVILAEALEHRLGPVHLIGGRVGVVVTENAKEWTSQLLG